MTDLTKLAQLAEQHSSSYASPHHFVLSVAGLRSIIEALAAQPGAVCRDLTDEDMDAVIVAIAELNMGDIGYHAFCDRIVRLAAAPTEAKPAQDAVDAGMYRKKPVVIEAFQMTRERRQDNKEWPEWLNRAWNMTWPEPGAVSCEDFPTSDGTDRLVIATLEGVHTVSFGDWIIKGVKGEIYPRKPDIFEATYERAAISAKKV